MVAFATAIANAGDAGFPDVIPVLDETFLASNPHYSFSDSFGYGLGIAEAGPEEFGMTFQFIPNPRGLEYVGFERETAFSVQRGAATITSESDDP